MSLDTRKPQPDAPLMSLAESPFAKYRPNDRPDGPPVWAFGGHEHDRSLFRIGTRELDWHSHVRGQLFCIHSGLVHVHTPFGAWVLPPYRAGWIPPEVTHRVSLTGVVSGWIVLVAPYAATALPSAPCVVGVSELLEALVKRAVSWALRDVLTEDEMRLAQVLVDEIQRAPAEPLGLPMPTDARVLRVARAVLDDLGGHTSLEAMAQRAGVSSRTARRLFVAETGMGFTQWRQQARLVSALDRLAKGEPVGTIADSLGYSTPSNFIAMFRRAFGKSPGRYFRQVGPLKHLHEADEADRAEMA
ncbi:MULTISPECIES: helix-turn-helix domain-containing protein [Pandoraea]|uniref:AraC family transcriptional regulator n=1 Tax=Pandoraea communis TaxID=2508297 RepID=A0A5E4Z330_9BURK|nr:MULTISPECIES: helix-turn-helix transcriptional regulator [Pandoraea]EON15020.1 AraC family transcriptional regulator [Pandoraea sp. SD6-2]VVE54543.1 AraC family transcriptional regulator [Pandoraea communis]